LIVAIFIQFFIHFDNIFLLVFLFKFAILTKTDGRKSGTIHFFYLGNFGSPDARQKQDMQDQENIKICTYNIVNGLKGCLTFPLKTMKSMGISLGILTETKLVNDIYPTNAHGYTIIATSAKNHHQGG
jgi:hypothetical protein